MQYIVITGQYPNGRIIQGFAEAVALTEGWASWRIEDSCGELLLERRYPDRSVRVGNTVVEDLTL